MANKFLSTQIMEAIQLPMDHKWSTTVACMSCKTHVIPK